MVRTCWLAGTVLAGWHIHRFHVGDQTDPSRLGPPADPLAEKAADGEAAPEHVPLPPVAKSLLLGAAVSTGLHVISLAESALSHGIASGVRRAVPGAGPVAGVAGHTAAFGMTLAGLRFAVEMQDAFLHEGVSGLHRVGMDRALFLGTPAKSKWARQWRLDPKRADPDNEVAEVASYADWARRRLVAEQLHRAKRRCNARPRPGA